MLQRPASHLASSGSQSHQLGGQTVTEGTYKQTQMLLASITHIGSSPVNLMTTPVTASQLLFNLLQCQLLAKSRTQSRTQGACRSRGSLNISFSLGPTSTSHELINLHLTTATTPELINLQLNRIAQAMPTKTIHLMTKGPSSLKICLKLFSQEHS